MGFLRQLVGGQGGEAGEQPPARPSRLVEAAGQTGSVYTRRTCPYCDEMLPKLPSRTAACPSCGQRIVRARGGDNLVYLVRESEAGEIEAEAEDYYRLDHAFQTGGRWDPTALRRQRREWLRRYAALGLRVSVRHGDESCAPCRALHDRLLDPASAPDLPPRDCRRRYCFCRYEPVLGDEPPSESEPNIVTIPVPRR